MDRSVQVNSKIGLCTFYLDYSGVDLKVWELEHVSKTVKIVASATVEEAILDGYLGLFSLPDTPRLIIFIKTYSFIQYSWLNVHEVSVQSLVFVTLKLNNFKPTSHLAITLAPSLTRFAILQSDDVLLIGEEIKTSLLAVNTNPMSWVTDLGVFKNYVQVENDLLLDMKDTPFSEDILVVTTKGEPL
ncbi:hypothetical protein EON65_52415 [archaeon]|nr:MAG: hypothetical protein EON65_52415 [archaeon]